MSEKMPCSAREYAWLKSELTKARRDLQRVLLTGAEGNEVQKEISQTYMTLIMFYEKALNSFFRRAGAEKEGIHHPQPQVHVRPEIAGRRRAHRRRYRAPG
ncbi:hypothetical protein [uncultured Flavonifractor sp.]|uniref:hypothetical protein n=1 Tax=uncultured Flavonifractor sp. TaxID=1193534 RepID=UPI002591BCAB|nr:hypothetical protein [uncultured Flavonifractor sp.]